MQLVPLRQGERQDRRGAGVAPRHARGAARQRGGGCVQVENPVVTHSCVCAELPKRSAIACLESAWLLVLPNP